MRSLPPRTPILVGVGQVSRRGEPGASPLELMALAMERAATDARASCLLAKADAIYVPRGLWPWSNPAHLLAERFGAKAETGLGPLSGNVVQRQISTALQEIAAGRREVAFVVGAEAEATARAAKRNGADPGWEAPACPPPDRGFGEVGAVLTGHELRLGLARPAQVYACLGHAWRRRRGLSPEAYARACGELWARFAEVAAGNPDAWIRDAPDATAISTPGPDNPWISQPFTRLLCAHMVVDQGAALVFSSVGTARRLGIPESRWVYPWAATDAGLAPVLSERQELWASPALRLGGSRVLERVDRRLDQVAHLDLYSCFPSAVQIARDELSIPGDRALTVTGGLTFAGGPFNSYVLHATARMAERLRAEPGSLGLVTSVGGFLSKHAFAVWSTAPPDTPFAHEDLSDEVATLPRRRCLEGFEGEVELESVSLFHARDGAPVKAVFAGRTDGGERTWSISEDEALLASLSRRDVLGRRGRVANGRVDVR